MEHQNSSSAFGSFAQDHRTSLGEETTPALPVYLANVAILTWGPENGAISLFGSVWKRKQLRVGVACASSKKNSDFGQIHAYQTCKRTQADKSSNMLQEA